MFPGPWALGWAATLAVQVVHSLVVAPTYHVGSFDDDGNYLMVAHALAHGAGLTATLPSGSSLVALYLPGYPALLVPLIWALGSALWVPRLFSLACVALLYPGLWLWMGGRAVPYPLRTVALAVLSLSPLLATFSTMAMAEVPFLALLVALFLLLDRWEHDQNPVCTAAVVVLCGALVWVKEAGVGLVAGVVLYLLWRRRWARAVCVGSGTLVLLAPGVIARWATGGAAIGDRYASEIANPGHLGLLHQVLGDVMPDLSDYLVTVVRQSVAPIGNPLPTSGPTWDLLCVFGFTVPVFVVLGAVWWYRAWPRAETWMVAVYFLETLAYPFTNQRRVILVLPVVVAWYIAGLWATGRWLAKGGRQVARLRLASKTAQRAAFSVLVSLVALLSGVPTAAAFTKNFQFPLGEQSSEFAHSPAMSMLRQLGTPAEVVETDYRGSVAYFTGHRTAWDAFTPTYMDRPWPVGARAGCDAGAAAHAMMADHAHFMVVGNLNSPGTMDDPCLLSLATNSATARQMGAVRLYASAHDDESVFELVGPRTVQTTATDLTAARPLGPVEEAKLPSVGYGDAGGRSFSEPVHTGNAIFTWRWSVSERVDQVSVGMATANGPVHKVQVELGTPTSSGTVWHLASTADGAVGDGHRAPFLLRSLASPLVADRLRVIVATAGTTARVAYVNAIGGRP